MNNELRIKNKEAGFTVLETLVVISIIVLLATLTLFSFSDLNRVQALDRSAASIISFLEEARSLTISSKDASSYGVFFDLSENSIILFKGQEFDPAEEVKSTSLHSLVEISSLDLGDGTETAIVFKRLTGDTDQDGTITLSLKSDLDNFKVINIFTTGLVELD